MTAADQAAMKRVELGICGATVKNSPLRLGRKQQPVIFSENPESLIAPAGKRQRAFCVSDDHIRLGSAIATRLQQRPRAD